MTGDAPLAEDEALSILDKTMEEHGHRRSALLEVLQKAQETFGYLDREVLMHISERLRMPPSQVYGAATFYNFFRLERPGEHIITPCMGTACYVRGGEDIVRAIEREIGIERGESTPDGRISLFVTRCIGACAMAPTVIIDGEVMGKATPEEVLQRVRRLREEGG